MQLVIVSFIITLFIFVQDVKAQLRFFNLDNKKGNGAKIDTTEVQSNTFLHESLDPVEIDILTSYYQQDGNNAAVTGGLGTEYLTDFTSKIIAKIPVTKQLALNLDGGFDYYSSASTDNIDNVVSSASSSDVRGHGNFGISYKIDDQQTFGLRVGGSGEYDYTSIILGGDYSLSSKNQNTVLGLSAQAFIDRWELIYPIELRRQGQLVHTDKRRSYNGALSLSQVLNKRMQISLMAEAVYMKGLLSTPFHRVYFQNQDAARVEKLPDTRLKLPVGVRFNYAISDYLLARLYYRYYWDDWGVTAQTASVELPIKFNRFFSVFPFYRYHQQTAADYFKPYKEHLNTDEFYTSDYDLADLTSHSFGLGLRYSPVNGLAQINIPFADKRQLILKSLDLKYSHYLRDTGLNADIISAGISLSF